MTNPADAAATARDGTNMRLRTASGLEAIGRIDPPDRPRPVPMVDPIDDVTEGP